jgi:hypothetical protein
MTALQEQSRPSRGAGRLQMRAASKPQRRKTPPVSDVGRLV